MALRVWMSAPDGDDKDVFVAVQKLDRGRFPCRLARSSRWRSRSCPSGTLFHPGETLRLVLAGVAYAPMLAVVVLVWRLEQPNRPPTVVTQGLD